MQPRETYQERKFQMSLFVKNLDMKPIKVYVKHKATLG